MQKLVFGLVLYLAAISAWAQNSISGKVVDAKSNVPLVGASLWAETAGRGTVTDENGLFELGRLSEGSLRIRVSYLGYETEVITVVVPQSGDLEIKLEPKDILTEEFIVSATRASGSTPTTFSIVDKSEIAKRNLGQDIPILLNFTPSVVSYSDAGAGVGYTGLRIRGTDQTRINATVNGIPLNDAESHGVFWVNMPDFASSVENVQIQRGVGTSTNGAATFGASLNFQTDTRRDDAYAELDNGFGSFNTWRHTVKAGTGLLNDRFAVDARLSKITSDGYVDRAFSDLSSWFVSGGYYGEKNMIKLIAFSGKEQTYQSWYGLPEDKLENDRTHNFYTYDNETDNYQQDHYQLIYTGKVGSNWKTNLALHYTYGRGYYEQYRENDRFSNYALPNVIIGDETITRTDIIRRRWLDNDFFGFVGSVNYVSTDGKLDMILGGGANRYDGAHFGEIIWARIAGNTNIRDRYYDNNAIKDDRNIYAKATYEVSPGLNLFGDLQVRGINYTFDGVNDDQRVVSGQENYTFFNPKFGFSYEKGNQTFYASYAVANREPTRSDFTDNPISEVPRPEKLNNIEAGVRAKAGNFSYNANFYYMDYRDQLILTGQINDVGAYIRENVASSYRAGIELDGAYRLSSAWTLGGNIAFSQNKIKEFTEYIDDYSVAEFQQEAITYTNTDIAFSPNVVGSAIIEFKPTKNLSLNWLSKYVGQQFLDNTANESRALDAFFTNDLRISYSATPRFFKGLEVNLLINNIFNELYEPNGYTFSYFVPGETSGRELVTENFYYPQAGTNFLLGLSLKF
ncbi:TonB-dependent receptor [Algoriphagus boritolerans]|uniref:Iron complex outermembrane recepter protein n=1 Tax=Algoriphagus boritolerans DSM 17298 = JCM 18970 TaxID=1120964 RepID=A0A1H5YBT8_9BACT|nr:TonB-dependent receptor [Algoriphagus boritolerans]SEG21501.1 iron complex outermembrane recepter protein [Algoriphagus boritolerans DSM 17298 = JCM 18970]